ncbi:MAG: peptidoglycan DD-metalloendopeptidase family protein [Muribaculaceae bacterium]|nr:peptidoglycan DD-metalloendopeptidase family protein [Muribaculaceae bacterium]
MLINKIKATVLSLMTLASGTMLAQGFKLPSEHNQQHNDLIAGQVNIGNRITTDGTSQYLEHLFTEEEEPEIDIFTEGWESQSVNPYKNMEVPQSRGINVSKYAMPCPGYVTSPYGYRPRFKRMHKGVDLKAATGDTIYAAFDGKVRLAKYERKGYGYYLVLRHPNELETIYGHLSKFLVKPDETVKAGQPIALAGNTGRSFGSHLHFETRFMGYAINPSAIFDFANQTVHTDEYVFNKNTYTEARNFDPKANQEHQQRFMQEQAKNQKNNGTAKSKGAKSYKVKKGDSLSRIATRNGVSVRQICKLNGLNTNSKLKIGQTIRLR